MKEVGGTLDVGQWELHPWLQRGDIVSWCRERGVVIEAYCPLVRGQRAEEESLKKLAGKYGKTWAQVLVRWSLQKVSVILGEPREAWVADTTIGIRAIAKERHADQDRGERESL
jgi:diketogulonate reductase-like aldo/keto reductase